MLSCVQLVLPYSPLMQLLVPADLPCVMQIDYFPSRNNNITASKIRGNPESTRPISGVRSKVMIEKENNFYQCALPLLCTAAQRLCLH
jgi:hypothetical protein